MKNSIGKGRVNVVQGLDFGDEAKQKCFQSVLDGINYTAKYSGAANAAGEIIVNGKKVIISLIPSGVTENKMSIIGQGVIINPITLVNEIKSLESQGFDVLNNLKISERCFLCIPHFIQLDIEKEERLGKNKVGTTKNGVEFAAVSRINRTGIRLGDYVDKEFFEERYNSLVESLDVKVSDEKIKDFFEALNFITNKVDICDVRSFLNKTLDNGEDILVAGNQGLLLSPFHSPTYKYCTSTENSIGEVLNGLGVNHSRLGKVYGCLKAYSTRVGKGSMVSRLDETEIGKFIQEIGGEKGTKSGRLRSISWLSLPLIKYSAEINGTTDLFIAKLDVLENLEEVKVITGFKDENGNIIETVPMNLLEDKFEAVYKTFKGWGNLSECKTCSDLPNSLLDFLLFVEKYVGVKISIISTGKEKEKTIKFS